MQIRVKRYHDISCGHRVVGHESKCRHLHGHNYRIHFECEADKLDPLGRVIDFGVVKEKLCMWLEENWDHKFLAYRHDPLIQGLIYLLDNATLFGVTDREDKVFRESIVWLPFNPTAEHMAHHLLTVVGPACLEGTGVKLVACTIEETAKCHVHAEI